MTTPTPSILDDYVLERNIQGGVPCAYGFPKDHGGRVEEKMCQEWGSTHTRELSASLYLHATAIKCCRQIQQRAFIVVTLDPVDKHKVCDITFHLASEVETHPFTKGDPRFCQYVKEYNTDAHMPIMMYQTPVSFLATVLIVPF